MLMENADYEHKGKVTNNITQNFKNHFFNNILDNAIQSPNNMYKSTVTHNTDSNSYTIWTVLQKWDHELYNNCIDLEILKLIKKTPLTYTWQIKIYVKLSSRSKGHFFCTEILDLVCSKNNWLHQCQIFHGAENFLNVASVSCKSTGTGFQNYN